MRKSVAESRTSWAGAPPAAQGSRGRAPAQQLMIAHHLIMATHHLISATRHPIRVTSLSPDCHPIISPLSLIIPSVSLHYRLMMTSSSHHCHSSLLSLDLSPPLSELQTNLSLAEPTRPERSRPEEDPASQQPTYSAVARKSKGPAPSPGVTKAAPAPGSSTSTPTQPAKSSGGFYSFLKR